MINIVERYLRKNFGSDLIVSASQKAPEAPALLVHALSVENGNCINEDEFIIQTKITYISHDDNQLKFLQTSQQIYNALKCIAKHETDALGVLKLSSYFKRSENSLINEFEYKIIARCK